MIVYCSTQGIGYIEVEKIEDTFDEILASSRNLFTDYVHKFKLVEVKPHLHGTLYTYKYWFRHSQTLAHGEIKGVNTTVAIHVDDRQAWLKEQLYRSTSDKALKAGKLSRVILPKELQYR